MNSAPWNRIRSELIEAGITRYGLTKSAIKELPKILHDNEHIRGIVYGQIGSGNSALLVATDLRLIYIDRRALFTTTDELTYDVVSGVKSSKAGPFTSIIVHTRINDYSLRYVNSKCAAIFTDYIEKIRLETGSYDEASGKYSSGTKEPVFEKQFDNGAVAFLKEHDLAVLSTVDRTGNVHGAVVYYVTDQSNFVYVLTKSETGKSRRIYEHSQIALTVHEVGTQQTLQMQGTAEVETDQNIKDYVLSQILKPRPYRGQTQLPPVTKLHEGSFMIIRIRPRLMSYHDYSKMT